MLCGYWFLREYTIPNIIYFITLITFLGKFSKLQKSISKPLGMVQFTFSNSQQLLGIGFQVVDVNVILIMVKI